MRKELRVYNTIVSEGEVPVVNLRVYSHLEAFHLRLLKLIVLGRGLGGSVG